MDASSVRQAVRSFVERTGFSSSEAHAYAPWFLHQSFNLPEQAAFEQSSDGNYDFGLDGFHLEEKDGRVVLHLIQAKYTDSLAQIAKGFRDLERCLPEIQRCLDGIESEARSENKIVWNLRAKLNRLDAAQRRALHVQLTILHASDDDPTVVNQRLIAEREKLEQAVPDGLPERVVQIGEVGPRELGPRKSVVVPPGRTTIHLDAATAFAAQGGSQMFFGVGRLADLVGLYETRRDDLFARNVRYYLRSKKNTAKGPAGKMKSTLQDMCIEGKVDPKNFALYHNGITIFVKGAEQDGSQLTMRDPYVLNGCQTIKNAFFFRHDSRLKNRIKDDLWREVAVPIRVIQTKDDELVRTVTVNNNRQNAMSPAALRANDPVQIRLAQRFRDRRIFYQRQEGAWESLRAGPAEKLEDEYANSGKNFVDLYDLTRSIAGATGQIGLADRPNELFESDAAYNRCFDEKKRLQSIVFLTLLQNLHDVLGVILKMDLKLTPKAGGPRASRFLYPTMCLLVRHLAKENKREFVAEWGAQLFGRMPAFREAVRLELGPSRSGIRSAVAQHCMTLDSSDRKLVTQAFESCERMLRLKVDHDPFDAFADIDDEVPVTRADDFDEYDEDGEEDAA